MAINLVKSLPEEDHSDVSHYDHLGPIMIYGGNKRLVSDALTFIDSCTASLGSRVVDLS